jgi:hypothetical protein
MAGFEEQDEETEAYVDEAYVEEVYIEEVEEEIEEEEEEQEEEEEEEGRPLYGSERVLLLACHNACIAAAAEGCTAYHFSPFTATCQLSHCPSYQTHLVKQDDARQTYVILSLQVGVPVW